MISENPPSRQTPAETSKPYTSEGSYLDWAAILAGGIFALAISFLLLEFGATLGLSLTSPYRGEGASAAWLAIAAGIWFVWVMVTGFGAGGYLAGRMRRRIGDAMATEVEVRDGAHGLMVWATGAVVGAVLAAMGVGGLVSIGTSAVGSAVGTAAEAAAEAVSSDYFANVMLRRAGDEPDTGASPGDTRAGDTAASDTAAGDTAAGDTAPSADGSDTTASSGRQPARKTTEAAGVDPAVQREVASIIARSAASGEMPERDRSYLAQLVAANTDLDRTAVRARIDEVEAELADAREEALAVVEKARVTGVVFGFIAAATLLIGAVAAFFAATAGGRHRDEGLGLDVLTTRR